MRARKYRKNPKSFDEVRHRFGWTAFHIEPVFSHHLTGMPVSFDSESERQARETIKRWAKKYMIWFTKRPYSTHIFPLRGAIFHFWFARGVRDAMHSKARLRTMALDRHGDSGGGIGRKLVNQQAEKLKIVQRPIVLHDVVVGRNTIKQIEESTQTPVEVHSLPEPSEFAHVEIPLEKGQSVSMANMVAKKVDARGRLLLGPLPNSAFRPRQLAMVKRAFYAMGVAATREIQAQTRSRFLFGKQ